MIFHKKLTKKICILFINLCLIMMSIMTTSSFNKAYGAASVSAKAAILIDAQSGKVLYQKNAYTRLPMASTTKIMSTLLCLESGDLDEYFIVDSNAIKVEGSSMGLQEGDSVTKRILCYGMMLPSGNDAANATAVKLAGSIENFAVMMNKKAESFGLHNTNFVTPSGLDDYTDDHYSTAYDMAILTKKALENPDFREICSTKNAKLEYGNPPYTRWISNSNKLLKTCDGVIGVKTGFTDKARRCLVSACERNGTTLICVTLNAPDDWNDHRNLYDYGFSLESVYELTVDKTNLSANVVGGVNNYVNLSLSKKPVLSLTSDDYDKIEQKICKPMFVYAPVKRGDEIGEVQFYLDGEIALKVPLVADYDVNIENIEDSALEKAFLKIKRIFRRIFD